jgi:hypothetical protein
MSKSKRKTSPAKDPRRMAVAVVQEHFDNMMTTSDTYIEAGYLVSPIDAAFDAIENALEAEAVKRQGKPIDPDEDVELRMISREAGYLIGVQVGLRLRGGAR